MYIMEENKDKFKEIMSMAKVELPFEDFDSKVMAEIHKIEADKQSISKTRKYALLSFFFGALFGLGMNYLFMELISTKIADATVKNYLMILSQMIYVILFALLIDKILKLRRFKKEANI